MQLRVGTIKYKLERFGWMRERQGIPGLDTQTDSYVISRILEGLKTRLVYSYKCRDDSKTPHGLEEGNISRVTAEPFFFVSKGGLFRPIADPDATDTHRSKTLAASNLTLPEFKKSIADQMGSYAIPVPVTTAADKIGPNRGFDIYQTVKYEYYILTPQNRPDTGWTILQLPVEVSFRVFETDDCTKPPEDQPLGGRPVYDIYDGHITPSKTKPAKLTKKRAERDLARINDTRDEARTFWKEQVAAIDKHDLTDAEKAKAKSRVQADAAKHAKEIKRAKQRVTEWLKSLKTRLRQLQAAKEAAEKKSE